MFLMWRDEQAGSMAAGNDRWVCTDRRTDADILKENAAIDTPFVIVSRDDPTGLVEAISMIPSPTENTLN